MLIFVIGFRHLIIYPDATQGGYYRAAAREGTWCPEFKIELTWDLILLLPSYLTIIFQVAVRNIPVSR